MSRKQTTEEITVIEERELEIVTCDFCNAEEKIITNETGSYTNLASWGRFAQYDDRATTKRDVVLDICPGCCEAIKALQHDPALEALRENNS